MQILDLTPEPLFAKFLIVHSEDETKPMAKVSPFTIARDLERTIGKSYNARKLTTGDLQIEVTTRQQSSALLSLDKIADISVTVTTHRTLNIVKGVISESQLLDCSDTEIEEGLKDQGVVTARRIVMRRDGFLRPSKQAILIAMYVRISRIRDAISSASVFDMGRRSVEDRRSVQNVLAWTTLQNPVQTKSTVRTAKGATLSTPGPAPVNGIPCQSLEEQANVLGQHFSDVSSSSHYDRNFLHIKEQAERQTIPITGGDNYQYNQPFTMVELQRVLASVKVSAPGPDRIAYPMLSHLSDDSKEDLLKFFNTVWDKGQMPSAWKVATVIPFLKPGKDASSPTSYRPVALTSCLGKTFERMVNNRLTYYLEDNNYFNNYQCGFGPAR
ncbi:uncharacterized protein LOC135389390 [Ornithodoros turicata]|uniref:uncharacterized protein LOC135389390 n=1 Tax=Ornithodoros turicata TaxID=34597 RepID=UPI003139BE36